MARHLLALGARFEQHHGRRERPQNGRETVPAGVDPLLRGGSAGGEDAELRLAFVQIQAYTLPVAPNVLAQDLAILTTASLHISP